MQAIFSSAARRPAQKPQQYRSSAYRNIAALASADAIEWEELPSLASAVAQRRQMPTDTGMAFVVVKKAHSLLHHGFRS